MRKVISSKNAPKAIGPYSQAIEVKGLVFVSGQLPIQPENGEMPEGVEEQTKQSLENVKAILAEAGLSMNHVIKTTVYLNNMALFSAMNKVYETYFIDTYPARSAFAVKELPKGALVEVECIAAR